MRLVIAAIGRLKDEGERALIARYMKRVTSGRAIGISPVSIEELPESRAAETNARQADEAARLLHATADCDLRIVLDERGRLMTSVEFAHYLGARRDAGAKAAALLIGGPRRPSGEPYRQGHASDALARSHDAAARAGPRGARRTGLSRHHDPVGASLSSRLNRAHFLRWARSARKPFMIRCGSPVAYASSE
jgi:23S rRNA (pseudouridine1915-N3)-methyltransferase